MVSEIVENIPNQFVSIRHRGILDGDQEITTGEAAELWASGVENYTFEAIGTTSIVTIDVDIPKKLSRIYERSLAQSIGTLERDC